jgi:hypothetical protein
VYLLDVVFSNNNKVKVYVLSLDSSSKLTNSSTSILRDNISTYLSEYRMLNDYVEVTNGKIINLSFQVDLMIDKNYHTQIMGQVISVVEQYMNINKYQMGENIYYLHLLN